MKKKLLTAALVLLASVAAHAGGATKATISHPATHGFVLFGDKQTYASHLPMYHWPHDFQTLIKVQLANLADGSDTLTAYANSKAAGQTEFTLATVPVDWSMMHAGSKFQADLFKGHFEKGGTDLGTVTVTISNVVYATNLNETATDENKYLIFGENGEYFAAHLIAGKPNFDLILGVVEPHFLTFNNCRAECPPPPHPKPTNLPLPAIVTFTPFAGASQIPAIGDELGSPDSVVMVTKTVIHYETEDLK